MNITYLIEKAFEARTFSHSPISSFMVGAALLGENGVIYQGCNVECGGLTPSSCAERTAFVKAISQGQKTFEAVVIVGGKKGSQEGEFKPCAPCGVCLQFMMEFCNPDTFKVILATSKESYEVVLLKDLLPRGFVPAWKQA
ncbi:MAG: cytidine deaminase [Cellulosilyticaceae bacterium]